MVPPDCAPIITRDFNCYRVSVIRGGRVSVFLCDTEAEALRFAELLSQPPVEPAARRQIPAPREPRPPAEPLGLVRLPRRWKGTA